MTLDQAFAFAIVIGLIALLIWDRIRYDLVALAALLAAITAGIVEPDQAFRGFSDDIVIIIGSALVVSAAVGRSGIAETLIRPLAPYMTSSEMQILVLATTVAVLSAFMKNIGALAIFIPIAFQTARRSGKPVSRLLMPLSFAALLGGVTTLIGTSPNIIVSGMRAEILGEPFRMFDFAPVGICLTVAGIAFLAFGWRLLPRSRNAAATPETLFSVGDYQTEVLLPANTPFVDRTVDELEKLGEGDVTVAAIIRENYRRYIPAGHWVLFADDVLVLQCDAHALNRIIAEAELELLHDKELESGEVREDDLAIVEAVIKPGSVMIGQTVEQLSLRERYGVNLLALSRQGRRIAQRLRRVRFQAGDLVVLRVRAEDIGDRLGALGCLPLAERKLQLGRAAHPYLAPGILAAAMVLAATGTVSVAVAFFGAAVTVLLLKTLTPREAYDAVQWPILVLLGALIPVSEALRTTGGTDLIAGWLSVAAQTLPPMGALALVLVAAMAVTPFLNNAATVLMMAPIGASLAARLDLNPDSFLMAVAIGAACDFLTPIGHQCNTLVMGPGGYRFGDYARLGFPLSVIVVVLGTLLIQFFWPLA
ncbi:SLC13 family permease [Rhodospirillaceae bacterium SYSU D60014]|uniref:SLC13 family permease n=1 Tax=Virgifigura deserti TaxID=2268457 RepID=UPI000E668B53